MAGLLAGQEDADIAGARLCQDGMHEAEIGRCQAEERKPAEAEQRALCLGMGERHLQERSELTSLRAGCAVEVRRHGSRSGCEGRSGGVPFAD